MPSIKIEKVLLVDDDDNIRLIAQTSLEGLTDWQVIPCSSGFEALRKAQIDRPDLVLLDVTMPGMDGRITLTKLKNEIGLSDVPVIFMTATVQTHQIDSYIQLGAAGVISKPIDPLTLPDDICELLAGCSYSSIGED